MKRLTSDKKTKLNIITFSVPIAQSACGSKNKTYTINYNKIIVYSYSLLK